MRISINPATLSAIATMGKACASADDVTPIIMAVKLTVEGASVTAVATDRYVAAVFTQPTGVVVETHGGDGETLIFVKTLEAAAKSFAKASEVTIVDDGETVSITSVNSPGITHGHLKLTGNYPPVERLFPGDDVELEPVDTVTAFNFNFFGKLTGVRMPGDRSPADSKNRAWIIEGQGPQTPGATSKKKTPIVVNRKGDGSSIRVLIQPNTIHP